ncbi:acyl-CoA dehydrogenase family protein [Gammaproteobacteria bacterium]|nr:acyl-CoA dehydrogenase family protein [Gammaproteobacteria bacterium]
MTHDLILDTAERVFTDHCNKAVRDEAESGLADDQRGLFPEDLWAVVKEAGLHQVGGEESGSTLVDAFRVIRLAGKVALPMPFAEILVSNRFFQGEGLTTVAEGSIAPWARRAMRVVTDDGQLVTEFDVVQGANLAGEPRDEIVFEEFESIELPPNFRAIMAMTRVASMCGGLEKLLELTIDYVGERKQFGRPISGFQAVQHNVARMAGEVAASIRASDAAIEAMDTNRFVLQVAAAKVRVGEAAGIVAEIAHQAHGAMGFTHEHELHQYTRRLWAWRDEYGHETEWQQLIGREVAAVGAERAWALISDCAS